MHAYEILFSPTGGTAKVAAALTTDWSSVKTIDLSIPSTHYEDICLESDSLAVIAMPAFGGAAPQLALDRLSRIHGNGALCVIAAVYGNRAYGQYILGKPANGLGNRAIYQPAAS